MEARLKVLGLLPPHPPIKGEAMNEDKSWPDPDRLVINTAVIVLHESMCQIGSHARNNSLQGKW